MTTPKRRVLLTAFLIFKILAFSATFCIYAFAADRVLAAAPNTPRWVLTVFCFSSLLGIASVVAIFRWMRLGFYVLCAMAVMALLINLYSGVSPLGALAGLLGPVILYALLQLGGDSRAWLFLR